MLLANFFAPEAALIILMLLSFASIALTIWAVIEIAMKPFRKDSEKVLWLIIVVLLGVIGPILYLIKRKQLLAQYAGAEKVDRLSLDGRSTPSTPREPLRNERFGDDELV